MKKMLLSLGALMAISFSAFANTSTESQENEWPFVCSKEQTLEFMSDTEIIAGEGSASLVTFEPARTFVDKKNKTITTWVTYYAKPPLQERIARKTDYANVAFLRDQQVFDMRSKRTKQLSTALYDCRGVMIDSANYKNPEWEVIAPGTMDDAVSMELKTQYKQ